jgi:pimeloyl-ACP methyl ester carboxylesterase
MNRPEQLIVRTYGKSGPWVIALHGGPAAIGEAAALARGLAGGFRVIEPWQRGSSDRPLSVARHVADLHEIVQSRCGGERPALVGESWGAMLALAYAAAHQDSAGPLVLAGCGTFDEGSRAQLRAILDHRTTDALVQRLARLAEEFPDPAEHLSRRYELTRSLYSYDPVADAEVEKLPPLDVRAHEETWADMLRLQATGVYPAAFAAIRAPVLMLHGDYDPHPGEMIRASLAAYLPQLEYHELSRCGHSPWQERFARDEFFAVLRAWLARRFAE